MWEIKCLNDIWVLLYIWWMIGFVSVRYTFHSVHINVRHKNENRLLYYMQPGMILQVCTAPYTACFISIQTIRQWKTHNFHWFKYLSLFCFRTGIIEIWKCKPRVPVFHCKLICLIPRDLIMSLYLYKHHTLSYNTVNMAASLKISNFDKISTN